MKSEPNEVNSDLQQLEEALRQSMMLSSEVSEARRNVPAFNTRVSVITS